MEKKQTTSCESHKTLDLIAKIFKGAISNMFKKLKDIIIKEVKEWMWSTGEGNGKLLLYSCLENYTDSMTRQNI